MDYSNFGRKKNFGRKDDKSHKQTGCSINFGRNTHQNTNNHKVHACFNGDKSIEEVDPILFQIGILKMEQFIGTDYYVSRFNWPNVMRSGSLLLKTFVAPEQFDIITKYHNKQFKTGTKFVKCGPDVNNVDALFANVCKIKENFRFVPSDKAVHSGPMLIVGYSSDISDLRDRLAKLQAIGDNAGFRYHAPFFFKKNTRYVDSHGRHFVTKRYHVGLLVDTDDYINFTDMDPAHVDEFKKEWDWTEPEMPICRFPRAKKPCPWGENCPYRH